MKILSLFDGMSCGMIAMQNARISVDRYVAYEVDAYAIETSTHNFPEIEQKGDVFLADFTEFKGFDFLVGGSPCTYWSIAKREGRETEASGMGWELFSQYVRALREAEPRYFIYENNKSMSADIRKSITETFGFPPVCINSALVSAQNRQRLYWVGRRRPDGTYEQVNVDQPEDRGILLRDILDEARGLDLTGNDKSFALTASYDGAVAWNTLERHQRTMVAVPLGETEEGKAHTIKAGYYKSSNANFVTNGGFGASGVAEPIQVGALPRPNGELSTSQAFRIYSPDGKSVTLSANGGGAGGKTGLYAIKNTERAPIVYTVRDGLITIKGRQYPIKLADGEYIIRKLSVDECKRLQTVPSWYEFPVSKTQAYKMLGNGWTCDVITHLIKSAVKGTEDERI